MLIVGALPRGGNHLLRGLLDAHPALVLPPDEDYFVRHLLRHPVERLRGRLCSSRRAPAFYKRLQKDGHLERVNAGGAKNSFGTKDVLDLDRYYEYVRAHHRRFSIPSMIRTHFAAMQLALGAGQDEPSERIRVFFCALQSDKHDITNLGKALSPMYDLRGVFVFRDPRSHFGSKLGRKPRAVLRRFCHRQNEYWREVETFEQLYGPTLRVRFESLILETRETMARICDFAGIEFRPTNAEFTQNGRPTFSNSSFANVQGIDPAVLSRYREKVPAKTIAYIEKHCRSELFWDGLDTQRSVAA